MLPAVAGGYPRIPIHQLFEQQAAETPDRTALISSVETVAFAELNHRANQIAHALRARGVKQETFVGLYLERSIGAIAALIGILKAGGAYVHLDPSYPLQRLREIAADAGIGVVLTNEPGGRIFGQAPGIEVLDLDSREIKEQGGDNPGVAVALDSAAYIIYTSGSTGKPKGAVEVHRSMISRLSSLPLPDIQPSDVCCLNSSLSFGITASRLFFPLVQGVPVVVFDEDTVKGIHQFARSLDEHRISSVFMVPALLRRILLLRQRGACSLQSLRTVTVTGATLTVDLIRLFRRLLPDVALINVYGSTETGTTAALRLHGAHSPEGPDSIGKAAPNTQIYVLDPHLNPVGEGETGEICVASGNLAREYLNRPALTAKRFVPNPFGEPGERLCRTGDLGRRLPGGEIQFRGRADHQVKIRGYRVELGEIEAALVSDKQVLEAAVTAPGNGDERRLVAYVVGRGSEVDIGTLKRSLGERLPAYMIPSAFVTLPALPLTASGKVDRKALPKPSRNPVVAPGAEPQTGTEKNIALLFAELLKLEAVSVHDNFIELGGDSLAATQLLAGISARFGVELPARLVFDSTLAELARELSAKSRTDLVRR